MCMLTDRKQRHWKIYIHIHIYFGVRSEQYGSHLLGLRSASLAAAAAAAASRLRSRSCSR